MAIGPWTPRALWTRIRSEAFGQNARRGLWQEYTLHSCALRGQIGDSQKIFYPHTHFNPPTQRFQAALWMFDITPLQWGSTILSLAVSPLKESFEVSPTITLGSSTIQSLLFYLFGHFIHWNFQLKGRLLDFLLQFYLHFNLRLPPIPQIWSHS